MLGMSIVKVIVLLITWPIMAMVKVLVFTSFSLSNPSLSHFHLYISLEIYEPCAILING
ncbi:hypothetical protein LINPERPRIM_LOCUS11892 [Linum perenne]